MGRSDRGCKYIPEEGHSPTHCTFDDVAHIAQSPVSMVSVVSVASAVVRYGEYSHTSLVSVSSMVRLSPLPLRQLQQEDGRPCTAVCIEILRGDDHDLYCIGS